MFLTFFSFFSFFSLPSLPMIVSGVITTLVCCYRCLLASGLLAGGLAGTSIGNSNQKVHHTTKIEIKNLRRAATRTDSFADGDMAGAENAWGASGGHVHGGAPPQL